MRMTQISFGFTMPGGLKLAELDGASCLTRAPTRISVTATATGLQFSMNPPIFVDAPWPAENVTIFGASYQYGGGVSVSSKSGEGMGWFDVSDDVHGAVSSLIRNAVGGTAMGKAGYNPFHDPDVGQTLQQVGTKAATGGGGGGGKTSANTGVDARQLNQVGGGASMVVDGGFVFHSDAGGVQVPAGTTITVGAQGTGNMGDLGAAQTDADRGKALQLQDITINSSGITLLKGDKPVARITSLKIGRGGNVQVTGMEPLGIAGDLSAVESMVRLFGGAMGLAEQGASDDLALRLASKDANAEIIPGMTKHMIEAALTPAVQSMVRQHAGSMPGIDLGTALGIEPEPYGPPRPPTGPAAAPPAPAPAPRR
jgi:hypothetical protein